MSESIYVLFIEDNPGDARLVQEELRSTGSKTILHLEWVDRLEKGLAHLASNPIQAVLLDLNLPDSEGLETLQRVITGAPSVPVIVMTGQADEAVGMQAVQAGAQDYLIKGQVDGPLLIRSIRYAIQRKQSEEALRNSEERFRRYFELGLIGMAITSPEKGFIEVNDRICEILGYEKAELRQISWDTITYPDDLAADLDKFNRLLAGEINGYSVEKRFIHKAGGIVHTIISVNSIRRADGSVDHVVALMEDITERKRAEERIAYQADLLENINDAVVAADNNFTLKGWNRAAEQIFGWRREEVLGHKDQEVIQTEFLGRTREEAIQELSEKGKYSGEGIVTRKDGTRVIVDVTISMLHDESGGITGFVSVNRDITDRKQAELELQESEERYQSLFENMLSGYAFCQMLFNENNRPEDFIYIMVNDAFEKLTGLKDAVGKRVSEVIPGVQESNPELFETYGRVSLTGKPERFETHIEALGIWFFISVYSPKQGYFVAVFDNITERKRAEAALKSSETRYRLAASATNDIIWEWDAKTNELMWSENAQSVFGYSPEESNGEAAWWDAHLHPEDRERVVSDMNALLESDGTLWTQEYRFLRKDGSIAYIVDRAYVERDEDGKPLRMIGAMSDISERKEAEEEIKSLARFPSENPSPILRIGRDGKLLYGNPASQPLMEEWKCAVGEYLPVDWIKLIGDLVASNSRETVDITCKDAIYSVMFAPIQDKGYVNLYGRDITERKQAEEEIKKQLEELLRWHNATLGRETRVLDLKREVNELLGKAGQPPRYPSAE